MSAINITDVTILDNPSMFLKPFQFEISYECLIPLKDDLEWKLIYVGSAEDEKYDQVLESVLVGPVNVGKYRFKFVADPPEWTSIPEGDILGVTVLLLTCSYVGQEFIRVGYYVSTEYEEESLNEKPPPKVLINKVKREILAARPRVTKFPIVFNQPPEVGQDAGTTSGGDHGDVIEYMNGDGNGAAEEDLGADEGDDEDEGFDGGEIARGTLAICEGAEGSDARN